MDTHNDEESALFRPNAQLKIAVTSLCVNDCPICFRDTRRRSNFRRADLPLEVICSALEAGGRRGFAGVYWTGGEPLLRYGELLELMGFARARGLVSTVVTNGGPLGAWGPYRELNAELLERGGTLGLTPEQMVAQMRAAGLGRVYLSVDRSHNSLDGAEPTTPTRVPTSVAARALRALLDHGFGRPHPLEAIGHGVRLSMTASGAWAAPSQAIVDDVMRRAGLSAVDGGRGGLAWFEGAGGRVAVKRLQTSAIGPARDLPEELLDQRAGAALFALRCAIFKPRRDAFDGGCYHGDLSVDLDGTVSACGNGMYPIGNLHDATIDDIIRDVNSGRSGGMHERSVAVFHRLLRLSREEDVGDLAIGEALRMVGDVAPELLGSLRTEGGACTALGRDPQVGDAFISAFDRRFG
jgi:hypothetical protein